MKSREVREACEFPLQTPDSVWVDCHSEVEHLMVAIGTLVR